MERIVAWENLCAAYGLARQGRHHRCNIQSSLDELVSWLEQLASEIAHGFVEVGRVHRFVIHDPKRRIISAAPFRERVLHHAMMRIAGPHLERRSIGDSYACRPNKGVHRARARAQEFSRRFEWFLKLDVRKYFDSVRHDVLVLGHLIQKY